MNKLDEQTIQAIGSYPITECNRVKRISERASYDKATVHAIIDSNYLCHVAFVQDGKPFVIPMAYWRSGEYLYLHSANKGRFATACIGNSIAVSIASFDGLVLGHSAFNHSYNYRSVVVQGQCEAVDDHEQKKLAMKTFVDHVIAGRWETLRPVTDSELRATIVMRIPLSAVSAKIRDEYPEEEKDDPHWPAWVGVIPAKLTFGAPDADLARNRIDPAPEHVRGYTGIDNFEPAYKNQEACAADDPS